jgi:chemosensory pili system protein ChpA (sensor histidine kinase/response regulator)
MGAASQTADAPTQVMGVLQDELAAEASTDDRGSSSGEALEELPVDEGLEVLKSGSDPEILEIYLEEAAEEADNIARLQQDWLLHPEDENAIKNIRRAFHTIKGSGRLVGATKIGEFAWEFEQLLNRVIDKTVPPSKQVINAVGGAARALPELVHELKTFEEPSADIASLRGTARALAEFKTEQLLIDHTQTLTAVESPYDHITDNDAPIGAPVDKKETTDFGFGATTQVIPPDIPAQAMTDKIEPDTPSVDPVALSETENREDTPAEESQPAEGDDATNLGNYDNTELTEAPQVPSMEERRRVEVEARKRIAAVARARTEASYERAVDYSRSSASHGEADDVALSGDAPAIEFVDQSEIDSLPSLSSMDASPDEQSSMTESPDDADELTPQAAEAESEELVTKAPTVERARELVMETPAQEVADYELEFEDIGLDADADEPESDQAEVESGEMPTSAQRRRDPPDPFEVATTSPVPGGEAGVRVPEPTVLSLDPELLTIYQQEVEQHLGTVNSALDRAEEIRELVPGEAIYRALHTINGASRTADIGTIGKLAEMLEKPLKSAIAQNMALDHEVVALYREGQRALQQMTAQLVETREMPSIPEDLQISLRALAEDFDEYTVDLTDEETGQSGEFIDTLTMMNEAVDSEQDNELLYIFVDEANELLEMSDNTLHQWSQRASEDPGAQGYAAVMELQRYLHTLKGGARMAELEQISDLSHEMESVFIAVIDGRIDKTANLFELLKDSFDLLHRQVSQAQQGAEMTSAEDMVALLKNLRLGEDEGSIADSSDQSPGLDMDSENIDIVSENLPGEPLSGSDRPDQDVIKVRATLLDNLVKIGRAHV